MVLTLGDEASDIAVIVAFITCAALAVVSTLFNLERKRRVDAERRAAAVAHAAESAKSAPAAEREAVMFDLHKRINELGVRKLEAKVALLQAQVKTRADDDDRIHAAREFHELNVEKTRLEIDSLRLHIVELRKRIDDFGLGGAGHD